MFNFLNYLWSFLSTQAVHHVFNVKTVEDNADLFRQAYGSDSARGLGMSSDYTKASSTYRNDFLTGLFNGDATYDTNLLLLPQKGYGGVPGGPVEHAGGHPAYNQNIGNLVRGINDNWLQENISIETARAQLDFVIGEVKAGLSTGRLPIYYGDSQFSGLDRLGADGLTNLERIQLNFFADIRSRLPTSQPASSTVVEPFAPEAAALFPSSHNWAPFVGDGNLGQGLAPNAGSNGIGVGPLEPGGVEQPLRQVGPTEVVPELHTGTRLNATSIGAPTETPVLVDIPPFEVRAAPAALDLTAEAPAALEALKPKVSPSTNGVLEQPSFLSIDATLSAMRIGVGAFGTAAIAVDTSNTFGTAYVQYRDGDTAGANQTIQNWELQNIGGIPGLVYGAEIGAVVGSYAGPWIGGALGTLVEPGGGTAGGAFAGLVYGPEVGAVIGGGLGYLFGGGGAKLAKSFLTSVGSSMVQTVRDAADHPDEYSYTPDGIPYYTGGDRAAAGNRAPVPSNAFTSAFGPNGISGLLAPSASDPWGLPQLDLSSVFAGNPLASAPSVGRILAPGTGSSDVFSLSVDRERRSILIPGAYAQPSDGPPTSLLGYPIGQGAVAVTAAPDLLNALQQSVSQIDATNGIIANTWLGAGSGVNASSYFGNDYNSGSGNLGAGTGSLGGGNLGLGITPNVALDLPSSATLAQQVSASLNLQAAGINASLNLGASSDAQLNISLVSQNIYNSAGAAYQLSFDEAMLQFGYSDLKDFAANYELAVPDLPTAPVVLDLTGNGINITQLASSNTFIDATGSGLQNRTAWAGVGNGVLVFDPTGSSTITSPTEYNFRLWDPAAATDMQALEAVFDTNHDGKLDAGDANWANFGVLVTNADGTTTFKTLSQLGITSINLTTDNNTTVLPDGSQITGQTSFTWSNGSTGTAADVSFAYDPNGYVTQTTTTHNSDGSTTIDVKGFNPDGSLANETVSTISAGGLSRTVQFDHTGSGVVDQTQTDVTVVNADGSKTRTLSDVNASGILTDRTVTTTGADGKTVTIARDVDGSGITGQLEARTTNSDGSHTVSISDLATNGALERRRVTTTSVDGLSKTVQTDSTGSGVFDRTQTDVIVVNSDGSRTETVSDLNADGSLVDRTITHTSADGRTKTIQNDIDGNGSVDLTQSSTMVTNADGSVATTQQELNGDGSRRDETVTTISASGLSKTVQRDSTGSGIFDLTTSDVTVNNADGSRTETVTDRNADGSLRDQTVTTSSADGKTRSVSADTTGNGLIDRTETVTVGTGGSKVDTVSDNNADGSLKDQTVTTTSADGRTSTAAIDSTGNGTVDLTKIQATVINSDGSSVTTSTELNADGSLRDRTVATTSADHRTVTTQWDHAGFGAFDETRIDVSVLNADGSTTRTVTDRNADGSLRDQALTTTSADRQSVTIDADSTGNGQFDRIETIVTAANGSKVHTVSDYNADGSLHDQVVTTTSGNGLSVTVQTNATGRAIFDLTETDVTVINANGGRTRTVTDSSANGTKLNQTVTTTSANGLSRTAQQDTAGSGTFDLTETDVTVLNANGSKTETVTDTSANGTVLGRTVTTTSASGLSVTTQTDSTGNGTFDLTASDVTLLNADGSKTETVTDTSANGTLIDQTMTTTSANGLNVTVSTDTTGALNATGKAIFDEVATTVTQANGSVVKTVSDTNTDGSLKDQTIKTTSANGLSITIQTDSTGNGTFERTESDVTVINANGSRTRTVTDTSANGTLLDQTVTTTSANGLSVTKRTNSTGNATFDRTSTDVTVLNADGSTTETVTVVSANGTLLGQSVTTTGASGLSRTISTDTTGNGAFDRIETIRTTANGSKVDTVVDYNADGSLKDRAVATSSANGLSKTTQRDSTGGGVFDLTETDVTVINPDGSRAETVTDFGAGGTLMLDRIVTTTSGNGLSKTTQRDTAGNGSTFDLTETDVVVLNADGSRTETVTDTSANGTKLGQSVTTTSANGLSVTRKVDSAGNGTFNLTTSDVTALNADGSKTETVTDTSANGTLVDQTVTTTSANGLNVTASTDTTGALNAAGKAIFDRVVTVVTQANGSVVKTVSDTNADGSLKDRTVTTTSATGLTVTTQSDPNGIVDASGNPVFGRSRTVVTTKNADGSSTAVTTDLGGDGQTVVDRIATTTSANGLVVTTTSNAGGDTTTTTDTTAINADGSHTEVVQVSAPAGGMNPKPVVLSTTEVDTSADRKTIITKEDTDGDGVFDKVTSSFTEDSGAKVDEISDYAPNGSLIFKDVTLTSANGLAKTETSEIDGKVDRITTDAIVLNADGSSTETVTKRAGDGTLVSQTATTTSGNGFSATVTSNIDGKVDSTIADIKSIAANGDRGETVTTYDATGAKIRATQTTSSANGLSKTILIDRNGDGTFDIQTTDQKTLNADGSATELATTTTVAASPATLGRTQTVTSANGLTVTTSVDHTGDGVYDEVVKVAKSAAGGTVTTVDHYDSNNRKINETITSTDASGLFKETQIDVNGDGTVDRTEIDSTSLNPDGSRTETVTTLAGSATVRTVVVTTNANGTTATTQKYIDGTAAAGALVEIDQSQIIYNLDGSITGNSTVKSQNGSVVEQSTTQTSANRRTTTITTNLLQTSFAANLPEQPASSLEVRSIQPDGSVEDSISYYASASASRALLASKTSFTSANGLSKTLSWDLNGDGTADETQSDVTTLGADGSTTETFTEADAFPGTNFTENVGVTTVVSGNGLTSSVSSSLNLGEDWSVIHGGRTRSINPDGGVTTVTTDSVTVSHSSGASYAGVYSGSDAAVVSTSRDGLKTTTQLSTWGNNTFYRTDSLIRHLDGSATETITNLNDDNSIGEAETVNTSADGRTVTVTDQTSEYGLTNYIVQSTVPTNDSKGNAVSLTTTSDYTASGGTLLSQETQSTTSNGLSKITTLDTMGSGTISETKTDVITLGSGGGTIETITETDATGAQIKQQVVTTSADRLHKTVTIAESAGIIATTQSDTVENADGSTTTTAVTTSPGMTAGTTLTRNKTVINTSADGRVVNVTWDLNGDGLTDATERSVVDASGAKTVVDTYYQPDGATVSSTVTTTTSANGRMTTVSRAIAASPSSNTTETTIKSADGSGSYSWTERDAKGNQLVYANHAIDQNGVDYIDLWVGGTEVNYRISAAQEAQDLAQVQSIYTVVLGRTMSPEEMQTWLKYYTGSGLNLVQLADDLMNSSEFWKDYGAPSWDPTQFVEAVYQNAFARFPSNAELQYWSDRIFAAEPSQNFNPAVDYGSLRAMFAIDIARIADPAGVANAQFNLQASSPYPLPFGAGGGGGGGVPDSIVTFSTTYGTEVEHFDPVTGFLQRVEYYNGSLNYLTDYYQSETGRIRTELGYFFNQSGTQVTDAYLASGNTIDIYAPINYPSDVFNYKNDVLNITNNSDGSSTWNYTTMGTYLLYTYGTVTYSGATSVNRLSNPALSVSGSLTSSDITDLSTGNRTTKRLVGGTPQTPVYTVSEQRQSGSSLAYGTTWANGSEFHFYDPANQLSFISGMAAFVANYSLTEVGYDSTGPDGSGTITASWAISSNPAYPSSDFNNFLSGTLSASPLYTMLPQYLGIAANTQYNSPIAPGGGSATGSANSPTTPAGGFSLTPPTLTPTTHVIDTKAGYVSGTGEDTFVYNAGYGSVEVNEDDPSTSRQNVLKLGSTILPSNLSVTADSSGNLYIADGTTGDVIELAGELSDTSRGVQSVQFTSNNTTWTRAQLIQAETTGTTGADRLYGTSGAETFDGRGGKDYVSGGGGGDTIIYRAGYGSLEIDERDTAAAPNNVLQLAGIASANVSVLSDGSNLYLTDGGAGDLIKIDNMVSDAMFGVQTVQLADATWHWSDLQSRMRSIPSGGPILSVQNASGSAGSAIALSIATSPNPNDASATLAVTISGLPGGASLSAGTKNADGSWTLTPAQLSGLTLTAQAGSFAGTAYLTITSVATDANGSVHSTTGSLAASIAGVATAPTLSVQNASGNAGTAIGLTIAPALTATDGTESLTITITGLPSGASLSAGTKNADGSWTLTMAQLSGLALTAPAGSFAGTANLTVTATATETDGSTAATSAALPVAIAGVATAPTLTVQNASGNAGTAIALSIASSLTATDGTEALSINVRGVPNAGALSAGTRNADGSWTLTPAQLAGLTLTAPAGSFAGTVSLTVTAIATETDGSTAATTKALPVTIAGVATAPSLSVQNASGNAGTAIALNITSALTATDGTESLSVTIAGVPSVATLSAGTKNANGSWTLTPAQLSGLTLTAPAGSFAGTANLTVIATATETDGSTAATSMPLPVVIAGVATAPMLTVQNASGNAGTAIGLAIAPALTATDGTESLSVAISGLPSGASLSAGTKNADGSWTLTMAQLSGLTLTAPAGSFAGTANLTVTAIATETDGSTAATTKALPVTIAGVATAPSLSVQNASGNAGTAIALNITSALTATDGTESLSVTIAGVPSVATLSAGTKNANGSWTLTPAQLSGLTLTAPAGSFAGTANLTVIATATETDGSTAATSMALPVAIAGVATAPTLTVQNASGNAGTAIGLAIAPALTATDGTESLSIAISGLPSGASLSAGTKNADGSWTLTMAQLSGLTLTAPAGSFAGTASLTVTATATEADGSTAATLAVLPVAIAGVATAPSLSVQNASGNAGTAIALNITSALTATDGTESLSVTIAGVPSVATLSAGTKNANGSWMLTQAQLSGLTLTAPAGSFAGTASLTVTATATEADGSTAATSMPLPVVIAGVASAPALTVQNASGNAGTAIGLTIAPALTATDGTESLSVAISGLPSGASLSAGTKNTDGSWTLTPAQLSGLTLTAPAGSFAGTASLTVTATATEADGSTAATSAVLPVAIAGVATAPSLSVQNASGNAGTAIVLNVVSALTATDGAESLSVTIGGVPSVATLSAGTKNANGSWTLTPAQLSGLTLTAPAGSFAGTANLTVTATATETDGSTAATSAVLPVTIAGIATGPALSVQNASGSAGTAIGLNIVSALTATDGAESLSITIGGVPSVATLSAGTKNSNGSWTLTPAQLSGLTLIAPAGSFAGTASLTVTATATEADGSTAATSAVLPVTVAGVATAPSLSVQNASGSAGTAIGLNIVSALTATDGAESLSIAIAGLPSGASLSAGVKNADGSWTLTPAQLSGLTLTVPAGGFTGTASLVVKATASETDGSQASSSSSLPVTIAQPPNLVLTTSATHVVLQGGAGRDTLSAMGNSDTLIAGSGANTLLSSGSSNTLIAATGMDTLLSSGSNDTLIGGSGPAMMVAAGSGDTLVAGNGTTTFLSNGAGNTLEAGSGTAVVWYNTSGAQINLATNTASLIGMSASDTLVGISKLVTYGSNNTLVGGTTSSMETLLAYGIGNTVIGGSGSNALFASGHNNVLIAGSGTSVMTAAGKAPPTHNTLIGGSGLTTFLANGFGNTLEAGSGTAIAEYGGVVNVDLTTGRATWSSNPSGDTLIGITAVVSTSSGATLIAGSGNDTLTSSGSANALIGGSGVTTLVSNAVGNTLHAGTGTAIASYAGDNVTVNLLAGTALVAGASTGDTLTGISVAVVSGSNDTLIGGSGNETLTALSHSTLVGGSGVSTLISANERNVLESGSGTTVALYSTSSEYVDLAAGTATSISGVDTLIGITNVIVSGTYDEVVAGSAAASITAMGSYDTLLATSNDVLVAAGGVGNALVATGRNNTLVSAVVNVPSGGAGRTTLQSNAAGNTLVVAGGAPTVASYMSLNGLLVDLSAGTAGINGSGFSDTLIGVRSVQVGGYNNTLLGSGGSDTLSASGVGNTLIGSSGNNTLISSGRLSRLNTLIGGSGVTTLVSNNVNSDVLEAGTGTAVAAYASNNITVNLLAGTAAVNGGTAGDTLVGISAVVVSGTGDTLIGGASAATLSATGAGDTLVAGSGGGTLTNAGTGGFYDVNTGSAPITIVNGHAGNASPSNELDFGIGISDSQLWFAQSGNDLQIDLMGTHEQVTVSNWFAVGGSQLSEVTAGGLKIDSQVSQLVQAMASYSTGHSGFDPTQITQVPNDPALQSAISAAWHS